MGYNTSIKVCKRHKTLLDALLVDKKTYIIQAKNPTRKAYEIREALRACQYHKQYEIYAHLDGEYKVVAGTDFISIVPAIPKLTPMEKKSTKAPPILVTDEEKKEIVEEINNFTEEQILGPQKVVKKTISQVLMGITDTLEIVSAVIKMGNEVDELFFPDAILSEEDKLKLYNWTKTTKWLYIDHEGAGITLTKETSIDPILLWEPPVSIESQDQGATYVRD